MAKGYWVAHVDVDDVERYKDYIAANAEPFRKYGAHFLVRTGRFENPEGASRTRNVVIEFTKTSWAAQACSRGARPTVP